MNDFLSLEELEKQKESIQDEMIYRQRSLYIQEVVKILRWFEKKFPKRTLEWMDGMGVGFWIIDDEIWDCDVDINAPVYDSEGTYWGTSKYLTERKWTRKERLLWPLVKFYKSINNVTYTDDHGVYIGCWKIDRISREIIQC